MKSREPGEIHQQVAIEGVAGATPSGTGSGGRAVKVRYLGLARNVAGKDGEELLIPSGATVRDLLAAAVERNGDDLNALLFTMQGTLRHSASVLIGGHDVRDKQGLDTRLDEVREASLLVIVDPIAGG